LTFRIKLILFFSYSAIFFAISGAFADLDFLPRAGEFGGVLGAPGIFSTTF
jgi:hypothetical protein